MIDDWRIELRDKAGTLRARLEDRFESARWSWQRIGGAGPFDVVLKQRYDDTDEQEQVLQFSVGAEHDVQIFYRPLTNGGKGPWTLWYRGLVLVVRRVLDEPEKVQILGTGYLTQLGRVIVDRTFTNTEISAIVKDILDNDVVPKTAVTYDAADIEATGFTVDVLTFKTTALNTMVTLAGLAGKYEWGVDENIKFFFKARSETVNNTVAVAVNVALLDDVRDFNEVVNVILLEGGKIGGSTFTRTIQDAASIAKFGRRERIVVNAAITTDIVADRFGANFIAEHQIARQTSLLLKTKAIRLEDNVPIGTIRLLQDKGPPRWGQFKWGQRRWGAVAQFQLQQAGYELAKDEFSTRIDVGAPRRAVSLTLRRLAVDLDFLRAANAQ